MVGASALGIAQAAYEWTLEYLEGKSDEDGPLLEQQRVQQMLADVATEIEAARMLVWRAAWMGRNGMPMTGGQGSMSKLKAGDVTMWATTTLMDLVGDYAQTTDCPLEKWFRDAKIYQLFEGTAQVQRLVIARMQRQEYRERREASSRGARAGPRHRHRRQREPRQGAGSGVDPGRTPALHNGGRGLLVRPRRDRAAAGRWRPLRARGAGAGRTRVRGAALAAGRVVRRAWR